MQEVIRPAALDVKTREQAAYDCLREAIVNGRFGPNERLTVTRIAGDLGVSRITVANALKRLAGEGFISLAPHKEAVVARLDEAGVREIYLMRAELEQLAARQAAGRISPEELTEAGRLNALLHEALADSHPAMPEIRAADRAFHRHVSLAAGMPRLERFLENLADQCEYYRSRLLDADALSLPDPASHRVLIDCLARRDGAGAGQFMREHVLAGMRIMLARLAKRA